MQIRTHSEHVNKLNFKSGKGLREFIHGLPVFAPNLKSNSHEIPLNKLMTFR